MKKWQFGVCAFIVLCGLASVVWVTGYTSLARIKLGDTILPASTSDTVLATQINKMASQYHLRIAYPSHISSFSLQDLGISISPTDSIVQMRTIQHSLKARLLWWKPIALVLTDTVNKNKLETFIANHITLASEPPVDASLTISNDTVTTHDAISGLQISLPNGSTIIASTAASLSSTPVRVIATPLPPIIQSQALAGAKAKVQTALAQHITISVAGTTISPSAQDIAGWITIAPDDKNKSVLVSIDQSKVQSYLDNATSGLTKNVQNQVVIQQNDGSTSVETAGVDGVTVGDDSDAAGQIASSIFGSSPIQAKIPSSVIAYQTITAPGGDKWIEVNTTTKRLYAYQQGALLRTFLVSAGAPLTPTVTGHFSIYSKYLSQDMHGANVDGSSYYQPHVPYVNYFYGDYAIHGNYWRPVSYFGNINSSHGCVGLLDDDAAWIYSWAPIGTSVIVHR